MNANQPDPAFPFFVPPGIGGEAYAGLSRREYFAAMAMQGLCADPSQTNYGNMATGAVQIADMLLSELDKTKGE